MNLSSSPSCIVTSIGGADTAGSTSVILTVGACGRYLCGHFSEHCSWGGSGRWVSALQRANINEMWGEWVGGGSGYFCWWRRRRFRRYYCEWWRWWWSKNDAITSKNIVEYTMTVNMEYMRMISCRVVSWIWLSRLLLILSSLLYTSLLLCGAYTVSLSRRLRLLRSLLVEVL